MNNSGKNVCADFAAWVRSRRMERRWSQAELARMVGMDPSYMTHIELDGLVPGPAILERLCERLGDRLGGCILAGHIPYDYRKTAAKALRAYEANSMGVDLAAIDTSSLKLLAKVSACEPSTRERITSAVTAFLAAMAPKPAKAAR